MTISGVHVTVAVGLFAAIGDISRFASPEKLVSYLGLNPSVRQSGNGPAHHGQITKQGRAHARGMLVEAAWAAGRAPGPLRAFFVRIQSRRGKQVAAVATARKLAVLAWHLLSKEEDYAWARPALLQAKLRKMELLAGQPAAKGRNKAARMPTTAAPCGRENGHGSSKRSKPTPASWPTGRPNPQDARVPQTGNARHRGTRRARIPCPLFTTRSPVRHEN